MIFLFAIAFFLVSAVFVTFAFIVRGLAFCGCFFFHFFKSNVRKRVEFSGLGSIGLRYSIDMRYFCMLVEVEDPVSKKRKKSEMNRKELQ